MIIGFRNNYKGRILYASIAKEYNKQNFMICFM